MSSPLDRIEAEAKARQYAVALHGGDQATQDWAAIAVSTGDVLALVNVAKAAEELHGGPQHIDGCPICEALAALGKEPA